MTRSMTTKTSEFTPPRRVLVRRVSKRRVKIRLLDSWLSSLHKGPTYGSCAPARSIEEGVGEFVGHILKQRK